MSYHQILTKIITNISGANEGYVGLMVGNTAGDGLVVLCNGDRSDNGFKFLFEIIRTVSERYEWLPQQVLDLFITPQ